MVANQPAAKRHPLWKTFKRQKYMQAFTLIGIAYLIVFSFLPMVGLLMAFKKFNISDGFSALFTNEFVGFKYFIEFFNEINFWELVRNTLMISILKLIFTFPVPILFALIISEVRRPGIKKFVQTASYLPHFVSWVVVSGILFAFFSSIDGVVNEVLVKMGLIEAPIAFLTDPKYYWTVVVLSDCWKEFGWWAILFIAGIAGIDPSLYEAAQVDGASRLQRIFHITLPGISSTIAVVLILSIGNLLGGGMSGSNFDQSYLLGNDLNRSASDIIQTYVVRVAMKQVRYSYATAVGLIQSLVSVVLIFFSNFAVRKSSGNALF